MEKAHVFRDFESLVHQTQQAVMRYLLVRIGSPADAAEMTQETFVRAYCALSKGEKPRHPLAWLLAIARNVFLEELRSRRYRQQSTERMAMLMRMPFEIPWHERFEQRLIVGNAVENLPDDLREPVLLHYFAGLSTAEVASHLDISAGAVKTRLWRARQSLRGELEEIMKENVEKKVLFELPADLAARAQVIAEKEAVYESLNIGFQVGGYRWATYPYYDTGFANEQLSLEDVRFAVKQLHSARLAGDQPLSKRVTTFPFIELFYNPKSVEIWEYLRSAEIGNEEYQNGEESHLVITDGWMLGTDEHAPELLQQCQQADIRHIWFTAVGLEQNHDALCQRPGSFKAILTAMDRCRDAGIQTGANIYVSTKNTADEIKELAELLTAKGAEYFMPLGTFFEMDWYDQPNMSILCPTPEDLVGLPPDVPGKVWASKDFWANPQEFTEAALRERILAGELDIPEATNPAAKRSMHICVMANFDVRIDEIGVRPLFKIGNIRKQSPQELYEIFTHLDWPAEPPSLQELARKYGNPESRTVTSVWILRQKWQLAWKAEYKIPWLAR